MATTTPREAAATARELSVLQPSELAWLLLAPALAVGAALVALLAPLLGRTVLAPPALHYWALELVVPKPTVQAGYALGIAVATGYAAAIVLVPGRVRMAQRRRRALVIGVQVALLALLAVAWLEQRNVYAGTIRRLYFTVPTVVAAAVIALVLAACLMRGAPRVPKRVRGLASSRTVALLCRLAAGALTLAWLLPAVATDRSLALSPPEVLFLDRFALDEAIAVLNGRSPFVDMAAYASIWPYVTAVPMHVFGASYLIFSTLMCALTGAALLALYGVLLRVTRHAVAALALYVPLLATSLFVHNMTAMPGGGESRYYPANYFGIFPLRYAGPYLLAWLTVRRIDGGRRGTATSLALFAAAGLVALNNLDFGIPALAATVVAVACTLPSPDRGSLRRLAIDVAAGLCVAVAAVVALTLLREGRLPQPGVMLVYGRTFASGGYGNWPLPSLGIHLLLSATFVAALASAAVRVRARAVDVALTGMLAWSGLFGLGASAYYYAYRSHPGNLIALFSPWALALALLVVALARATGERRRAPTLPELAVLLGFGLAVCSIAQLPHPGTELRRIRTDTQSEPMRRSDRAAAVASVAQPGEHVAILDAVGHRIALEADTVNVSPYTGLEQIGASEQIDDVLRLLEREAGRRVFVSTDATVPAAVLEGTMATLVAHGYGVVERWPSFVELVPGGG